MKKFAIVLVIALSYAYAEAQLVVSAVKMNVLYAGIENPVAIAVSGYTSDALQVSAVNATIFKKNEHTYGVIPNSGVKEVKISVASQDSKALGEYTFRVKEIPSPVARFAGKPGGSISKEQAVNNPIVDAVLENFLFDDMKFQVVSFNFVFLRKGTQFTVQIIGNQLNDETKKIFRSLKSGSKFYFESIKVIGSDKVQRELAPMAFTII